MYHSSSEHLRLCEQAFRDYYEAKTTHRRLTWTYSLGSVLLKGNFGGTSTVKYNAHYIVSIAFFHADDC